MDTWLDIATISNKKGLDGGLVLEYGTNPLSVVQEGMTLYFVPPRLDVPRSGKVISSEPANAHSSIVHFDTISDVSMAEALIGCHCLVVESEAASPEFLKDVNGDTASFIGWVVEDVNEGVIGRVEDAVNRIDQVLLSVVALEDDGVEISESQDAKVYLIPLADAFLVEADPDSKTLLLDLPAGLLEL